MPPRHAVARTALLTRPAIWWLVLGAALVSAWCLIALPRLAVREEYLERSYPHHATSRIVAPDEIPSALPIATTVPTVPATSDPTLAALADDVRATMAAGLAMSIRHPVRVRYADPEEMVVRVASGNLVTMEQNAIGKFRRTGDTFEVFVLAGTSPREAARILAHELGHVYYEENFRAFKSRLHREGFAEWVAYRVLGERHALAERLAMRSRADVYGQGLRLMLQAEKTGGTAAVVHLAMD
jgi:hypothetical protein